MKKTITYIDIDCKINEFKVDPVYYYALVVRNKIAHVLDWLLMRIHTWRTGIKHKGSNPRVIKHK